MSLRPLDGRATLRPAAKAVAGANPRAPTVERPSLMPMGPTDGRSALGAPQALARGRHAGDLGDRGQALADLLEAVVAQAAHARRHRDLRDAVGARPLDRQRAD